MHKNRPFKIVRHKTLSDPDLDDVLTTFRDLHKDPNVPPVNRIQAAQSIQKAAEYELKVETKLDELDRLDGGRATGRLEVAYDLSIVKDPRAIELANEFARRLAINSDSDGQLPDQGEGEVAEASGHVEPAAGEDDMPTDTPHRDDAAEAWQK